jgi:lipopolysaccharide/colanic/teichoic acid biosynthesis glycosyltransferase
MIIFETGNPDQDSLQVQRLAQMLVKRIRSSDEAGWFDGHRIGVVLPETSAVGAWELADYVCQTIAAKASRPECTVYTYPSKWYPDNNEHSHQLHFADLSPEWKTPTRRGFSVSAKHSASKHSPSAMERPTAGRIHNSRGPMKGIESFLIRPLPFWKRAEDIVGATIALIVFSPIMVAVAIAIKLTSKGPVTFKQQRAGLGGKPFMFYKFRSMVVDAEARKKDLLKHNERIGPAFKMTNDPRVTCVGDFIRKWSLDELPQLFNVLRGDLSLVGPRPLPIEEALQHNQWQDRRLYVTPGITGLWQVYARDDKSFDRWARLDIEYIMRRSLLLDLKILLKTLPAVLSRKGAC